MNAEGRFLKLRGAPGCMKPQCSQGGRRSTLVTGNSISCVRTQWKDHTLTATFRQRLIYLQLRTRLGKEKGRRSFVQRPSSSSAPHSGQSSVRQAKLGVSDWVQVPIE